VRQKATRVNEMTRGTFVYGPEESRAAAIKRNAYTARLAKNNYVNKEVRALDCTAEDSGMQGNARRFDSASCKVRVDVPCFLKGYGRKKQCLEQVPRDFHVGTIFMVAEPRRPYVPMPGR